MSHNNLQENEPTEKFYIIQQNVKSEINSTEIGNELPLI